MKSIAPLTLLVILTSVGCGSTDDSCESTVSAAVESLQWKRMNALEADLVQALALDRTELCRELDLFSCTDIHRVSLGASNPFGSALYEPVARPLTTTPTAIDRVILSACSRRAEVDAQGSPVVFKHIALTGNAPGAGSPEVAEQTHELYKRLLQREATADEIAIVGDLATDDQGAATSAIDFAKLSCFAIATTTEFILF